MIKVQRKFVNLYLVTALSTILFLCSISLVHAASLYLSPSTGVYQSGGTFTANVMVNTGGQSINAADGALKFNPNELSVVSVNRTGSIFNLWVAEPSFSNSAGTVNFSGGVPSGYSSQTGKIMSVTFRAKGSGSVKVNFSSGSVLANDGRGSNILSGMNGGTYTLQAASETPEAEVIEYVAPANTPAAPVVKSSTHEDSTSWYASDTAVLSWSLPGDVTAVRTLLDASPSSIPTKVYDSPINEITLQGLDQGVSYFHIQFKNSDGWGRVAHYRLAVDTENPTKIEINQAEGTDLFSPEQVLKVEVSDETSPVVNFKIKINNNEPFDFKDETGSGTISLPPLEPGYHAIIIEAFDAAGNSIIGTYSFTLESFDKPVFTDYPSEINEEVIPVIKGRTRPKSTVEVYLSRLGSDAVVYNVTSDESGVFIFIPESTLTTGVYELTAVATDEFGAKSQMSDVVRIAVQQPGYLRVGSIIISVLSVIIPLLLLIIGLAFGIWYLFAYAKKFRRKVKIESIEALQILKQEFSELQKVLREQETLMQSSRKTNKLTKAEAAMIEAMNEALKTSQTKVEKEIVDITELTTRKNKNK